MDGFLTLFVGFATGRIPISEFRGHEDALLRIAERPLYTSYLLEFLRQQNKPQITERLYNYTAYMQQIIETDRVDACDKKVHAAQALTFGPAAVGTLLKISAGATVATGGVAAVAVIGAVAGGLAWDAWRRKKQEAIRTANVLKTLATSLSELHP